MQQEENYLAQSISQVDADARYDEGVKRLLANKSILAVIMKECVPEYHGCTVREIAEKYIEGEPQIGAVGVDADETNRNVSAVIFRNALLHNNGQNAFVSKQTLNAFIVAGIGIYLG